jgi:hypothetical protein
MSLCVVVQVSTYGAEQFDPAKPQDRKELESFFNWFYWWAAIDTLYTKVSIDI